MPGLADDACIGFDGIRALRNATGLGHYARRLLAGLHDVAPGLALRLYSPAPPRPEFAGLAAAIGATVQLPPPRWRAAGLRAAWRTLRLGRTAARDGVALYHGLTHEIPRDLPATGLPSVVTVHDLLFLTHPELFPAIDRRSYAWRYRWSIPRATAVVAVSSATRDALRDHLAIDVGRIAVIPPARDPRFGTPVSLADRAAIRSRHDLPDDYVVMVGTVEARKNHRLALDALATLGRAAPTLVVVGRDGGAADALKAEAARRGLADRVRFRDAVSDTELPAVVQSASVALYLSTAEGFGMPIIEAMSAAVPVVVVAGAHLQDAAGDAAVTVPPDDPAALGHALVALRTDAARRADLVAAGLRHAAGFDAGVLARRLLRVYDAVVAGRAIPTDFAPDASRDPATHPPETSL